MKKIAITTGDQDGVGIEVTYKALSQLGPQPGILFFVFRGFHSEKKHLSKIARKFKVYRVQDLSDALSLSESKLPKNSLIEIVSDSNPAKWVEEAARACYSKKFDSLVTAPLSKTTIQSCGLKDIGHTDILKRICRSKSAYMAFVGDKFNVVLASGHLPIEEVSKKLTSGGLKEAIKIALKARQHLPTSLRRKPVGLLGLDPHAGDQGVIGDHDRRVTLKTVSYFSKSQVIGPLVPDVAFIDSQWKNFSFYMAQYHDQGLIPFKMVHGFNSGVHLTLGLPIKRCSVDHGTAKDIFGKGIANSHSMFLALKWGIRLAKGN